MVSVVNNYERQIFSVYNGALFIKCAPPPRHMRPWSCVAAPRCFVITWGCIDNRKDTYRRRHSSDTLFASWLLQSRGKEVTLSCLYPVMSLMKGWVVDRLTAARTSNRNVGKKWLYRYCQGFQWPWAFR